MVLPVAALAKQSFAQSEHHDLVPGLAHIHRVATRVGKRSIVARARRGRRG